MNQSAEMVLAKVEHFVQERLKTRLSEHMYFHNLEHTLLVVEGVKLIGRETGLSESDLLVVLLAAYLHDVGYTEKYMGHEAASAEIAARFLLDNDFDVHGIELVKGCIMATQFPQNPKNELEMVICDADFFHFSLTDYLDYADRLKREWAENLGLIYTDLVWDALNLQLLKSHEYFTTYGKTKLQQQKKLNIEKLQFRII